ncbi:MAG: PAS domain-containing protein, partial [Rhodospirillales bacterium]
MSATNTDTAHAKADSPAVVTAKVKQDVKQDAENERLVATLRGIGASQAMIEFEMDGTIITANENFLTAMGYQLSEIEGEHHSLFVESEFKKSPAYGEFWDNLRSGKFQTGEFMRVRKDGGEVWLQAAYNPVLGPDGKPYKVVKTAVDITGKKVESLEKEAENERLVATLQGIGASQAMIEFEMDGTIITANENFLTAMGYQLSEIEGEHHSLFVESEFKKSPAYGEFWDNLRSGKFQTGEFMRVRKDGGEVWLQAAYNPVLGADGKPCKVVKTAVDITGKKVEQLKVDAEAARLLQMIETMPMNVMLLNPSDYTITYV